MDILQSKIDQTNERIQLTELANQQTVERHEAMLLQINESNRQSDLADQELGSKIANFKIEAQRSHSELQTEHVKLASNLDFVSNRILEL